MSDKAKRLGAEHQWWAYRGDIYCNFCQCDTDSERAFKTCKPKVEGKGFHTIVFDDIRPTVGRDQSTVVLKWGDRHVAQVETEDAWRKAMKFRYELDRIDEGGRRGTESIW